MSSARGRKHFFFTSTFSLTQKGKSFIAYDDLVTGKEDYLPIQKE
jgi:hypothetical protein